MQVVKAPLKAHPGNSVVAFKDNSSAIRGFEVSPLLPSSPGAPGPLAPRRVDYDLLLTAETHNFPCAVAPYPGERVASFFFFLAASEWGARAHAHMRAHTHTTHNTQHTYGPAVSGRRRGAGGFKGHQGGGGGVPGPCRPGGARPVSCLPPRPRLFFFPRSAALERFFLAERETHHATPLRRAPHAAAAPDFLPLFGGASVGGVPALIGCATVWRATTSTRKKKTRRRSPAADQPLTPLPPLNPPPPPSFP
jgi:hypothetical protein